MSGSEKGRGPAERTSGALLAGLDEPEREQVNRLLERMGGGATTPESVGRVLPQAVMLRSKLDSQLPRSFVDTTEKAIRFSVDRDADVLSEALFLVIGPAIRKALAKFVRETVQSLNRAFDRSLSPRSIGWRFQAMRTGRSFAEIALQETLAYRVEQAYLVHRRTGILLCRAAVADCVVTDPDMVSAMLQAVQDFMRDSLKLHRDDTVESISVGRFSIVVEAGPHAVIALVVQGSPPPELRLCLQEALETAHLELREELAGFRGGDTEPFSGAEPVLRACLRGELKASERRFPIFAAVLGALLLAAVGAGIAFSIRGGVLRARLLGRLADAPGIVVVETGRQGLRLRIDALRDPAAEDPEAIAAAVGFPPGRVVFRLKPYYAMAPELTLEHVRRILNPPATVRLSLKDGVVHADGPADALWTQESRLRAEAIPGVHGFEASDEGGAERAEMADLIGKIRGTTVMFQANATEPVPGQDGILDGLAARIARMAELARGFGFGTRVTVTGHSAGIVADADSIRISHERAAAAIRSLSGRGVAGVEFQGRAIGVCNPAQEERTADDKARNRRVSFAVETTTEAGR